MMNSKDNVDAWYRGIEIFKTIETFSDVPQRIESAYERIYELLISKLDNEMNESILSNVAKQLKKLAEYNYKDAAQKAQECEKYEEFAHIYNQANGSLKDDFVTIGELETAKKAFERIQKWHDAKQKAEECEKRIAELNAREEKRKLERERERKEKRWRKGTLIFIAICILYIAILLIACFGIGR